MDLGETFFVMVKRFSIGEAFGTANSPPIDMDKPSKMFVEWFHKLVLKTIMSPEKEFGIIFTYTYANWISNPGLCMN